MYFYSSILKLSSHHYQQLKCICTFIGMLIPIIFIAEILQNYSIVAFQVMLLFAGWLSWTFFEYILHRFYMHSKSRTSFLVRFHKIHHSHPSDIKISNQHRSALLLLLVVFLFFSIYLRNYFTIISGFYLGIVIYAYMHKVLHHKMAPHFFKRLFLYHVYHHCKYHNTCFGVSVPWWDDLFKTVPKNPFISKQLIQFYFHEHQH